MTAPARRPGEAETGAGWYVYGVVPAAEAPDGVFDGLPGVGGGSVALIPNGPLAAIATDVPLAEFGEAPIAENLRDPDWLERGVRAHEAVLQAALTAMPVVPFRFGTIYRNEDHVREMLNAQERLIDTLERLRGKLELGVKGFVAASAAGAEAAAEESELSAGRRYLEEKQRDRRLAEEREAQKARWADESHERLAAVAEAATANALQPRELSGRDDEMFLNGAYLVAVKRAEEFRRAVAALEGELGSSGARYELTGPWPPYNFVEEPA